MACVLMSRMLARRFMKRKHLVSCVATLIVITLLTLTGWRSHVLSQDIYSYENLLARGDTFAQPFYEEVAFTGLNISKRFDQRRRRVLEVCRYDNISVHLTVRPAASRFVFPTTSFPTVLYCPVPRVATTFMRRLMAAANNVPDTVTWRERFHVRNVVEGYDKATMFLFTREPYSRLLSAYINTLWVPNLEFWTSLGGPVIGAVRKDPTMAELACGNDVTFAELIRYIILSMGINHRLNGYFMPAYSSCEVCNYDYDYIGHMETFSEDAAHILSVINLTLPSPSPSPDLEDDESVIISNYVFNAFVAHKTDSEKCMSRHHLFLRVWRALQIRGLINFRLSFPLAWENTLKLRRHEFRTLLHEAVNKSKAIFEIQDQETNQSSRDSNSRSSSRVSQSRVLQRRMALASAWSLVPAEDRRKIRDLFDKEFKLFGYDPFLQDVFSPMVKIDGNLFDLSSV